ncbi:MAG: type ISP restriction/modification enzyme [Terricaulis sp.]
MEQAFQTYLTALRKHALAEKTEHTDRGALETLLQAVADDSSAATKVQHEPKRAQDKGAPDYKITRTGVMVGYVEAKQIGANLEAVLKTDQIKRYLELNPNLIVTDYLRFIWIKDGKLKEALSARLCESGAIEGKQPLNAEKVAEVEQLLRGFFKTEPKGVKRASELAEALAVRSKLLRDFLTEELERQQKEEAQGKLLGLYKAFKEQVSHELKLQEFADAFAQTLAYGLFLAKLNVKPGVTITLSNADEHVPGGFSLIRELVGFLKVLNQEEYRDIKWVVEEILSIVNHLNVDAIREDLSFKKRRAYSRDVRARTEEEWRLFSKDPFVYFYEDYLAKYDKAMKKARGVYYTPPPIVNFIVRAINDILKDTFEIEQGLADRERVTVLDFACGTGTFLVEVLERIFDEIGGPESGIAPLIVREHILKNIYGFEYLIAPYTIAHLKLSQYLAELAVRAKNPDLALKEGERFQVFLTNTLEPIEPQKNFLLPELTHETEAAQKVKDKQILVITGNPPYSGHSKNMGPAARASVEKYREGFPELNKPAQGKWLQDDYVKFIRFAQMKMEPVENGVVGVITNHSFLDNPTFRGMRKSLMETFDQLYLLDLHGNRKKKEKAPDGSEDENVFDIEQGVSIALFVKGDSLNKCILHADVFGKRQLKYQSAVDSEISKLQWSKLEPRGPMYLFVPRDDDAEELYRKHWSIRDIFSRAGDPAPGIVTTHDEFAISFTADEAVEKVRRLVATKSEQEARALFRLCSQEQWNYDDAKSALAETDLSALLEQVFYAPFDVRWTIWSPHVAVHRRERVMRHMRSSNMGLAAIRKADVAGEYDYAMIVDRPMGHHALAMKEVNYLFPLWLQSEVRIENLSPAFRAFIDARYDHQYLPEEILGFIYAVLHAPTYRRRYSEFLRIDFPRVPFPDAREHFDALSALGWALVEAHLLKRKTTTKLAQFQSTKSGEGRYRVEANPRYVEAERKAYINAESAFAPIPPDVWGFHIGGYQVLDKYLRSRKGRDLSLDEIEHIAKVADVLAFTITQMTAIDAAYQQAFPAQT